MQRPTSCAVALKEWATVLEAMARGEQLVLIRKGGLLEPGRGFEVQAPAFLCYPTFEHQTVNYLRPPYQPYLEAAARQRAPEGRVQFALWGVAMDRVSTTDGALVERLSPYHIYNEAFLSQRLKWQPQQPLMIVVVRVYRLASPVTLPVLPRYAGCRSWVELEASVSLDAATPALSDEQFEQRVQPLRALLG